MIMLPVFENIKLYFVYALLKYYLLCYTYIREHETLSVVHSVSITVTKLLA